MIPLKRFTAALLILTMVLSMGITAAAEESNDRDTQADFLNQLTILRGDGSGYNFEGQLKRSEAATFIVRMLGKDKLVTASPEDYTQDTFSDVAESDWFAPYVGYCVREGIVGGFEDGSFRPHDFVSEKAFLKMLMTAMGYAYNDDFSWSEVYSYAYELNLVTDMVYKTKVNDNYTYTRGDVIGALFDTLRAAKKNSSEQMIQYFIDEEIVDESAVTAVGLMGDDLATEIEDIEVLDANTIVLILNEKMSTMDPDDMIIYEKENSTNTLGIESIKADDEKMSFTIELEASQEVGVIYGLLLDDVRDSFGNRSGRISDVFKGYRPEVVASNYFRISKVTPLNAKSIQLHFTHPVNANVVQSNLYTITEGKTVVADEAYNPVKVSLLPGDDSAVVLTLDQGDFDEETDYTLIVSGTTTSQYGVKLDNGNGDQVTFQGLEVSENPLVLEEISTPEPETLLLKFNKEVSETIAQQVFSYYLTKDDEPIQITEARLLENGMDVQLSLNHTMVDGTDYDFMINRVRDLSGADEIIEQAYDFTAEFVEVEDVAIVDIDSPDESTIVLRLSRALDETTANNESYYDIDGVGNTYYAEPVAVYYDTDVDPLTVKLFLGANKHLVKDDTYEVALSSRMEDSTGRNQSMVVKEKFTHDNNKASQVYIEEAMVVGEATVKLTFSKEIALDVPNVLNTNYTLMYEVEETDFTKIPISANYIDPMTMIVRFDEIGAYTDYTLHFESLVGYSGATTDGEDYSVELSW